jgi:TP901 family phage tail tape measure protein
MANIGTVEGVLRLKDEFTSKLNAAAFQLEKQGKRMEKVGRQMSDIGSQLTRSLTLPLAAIGGVAVKSFADFDGAMNKSLAIMGDVSETLRSEMTSAARKMATQSVFSAKQAAESYFFLASAGLDAQTSIAALPTVTSFAQAGMFDMALATDLLTDAQSALGLTIRDDAIRNMENMVRVSDVLVKANTLANATVHQFSESLTSEAGAALKSFGIDVEEGVAVLAAFADQGVKGQVAGTSLSRILRMMTSAAVNNSEAYKRMRVEVFDAGGNIKNMADVVADLERALGDLSDEQRVAALETLGFQARIQGVILPLLGTSDAIRQYEKGIRSASGITEEVANKQLQAFGARMGLVKDQILDVAITLGESLAPSIEGFARNIVVPATKALAALAGSFAQLPGVAKVVVVAVGALAAAIGPALFVTGQLITAWGTLITTAPRVAAAIKLVTVSMQAMATLGVAVAVVAINHLITKWGEASEAAMKYHRESSQALGITKRLMDESRAGEGIVSAATFAEGKEELARVTAEIKRMEAQVSRTKQAMDASIRDPDAWARLVPVLDKQVKALREAEQRFIPLSNILDKVDVAAGAASESLEGVPPTGVIPNVEALTDALQRQLSALSAVLDPLVNMRDQYAALREQLVATELAATEEDLRRIAKALELGLAPMQAMEGATRAYLDELLAVDDALAATEQAIRDMGEALVREHTMPTIEAPAVTFDDWIFSDAFIDELTRRYNQLFEVDLKAIHENYLRGLQSAFSSTFRELLSGEEVEFRDFFQSIADVGAAIIAEQIGAALTKALSGQAGAWKDMTKFFNSAVGQATAWLSVVNTISAASNTGYAIAGAAIGAIVGGIAAGAVSGGMGAPAGAALGAQIGAWLGSMIKHGSPEFFGAISAELGKVDIGGKLGEVAKGLGTDIAAAVQRIMDALGAELESIGEGIKLKMKDDKLSVIVDGDEFRFKDKIEQGISFAIAEALKRAEISGISEEAKAALANTVGDSVEEILSDLDFARFIEQLGLTDSARALDDFVDQFRITWNRMVALGIDGAERLGAWAVKTLEAQRNAILGIEETVEERIRREAEGWQQQKVLIEAEALLRKLDLEQRAAALRVEAEQLRAKLEMSKASMDLDRLMLEAGWELLSAEAAMLSTVLQQLALVQGAIAGLDAMLDALSKTLDITEKDIQDAIRRARGGGGGQRKADQERLNDLLAASLMASLPDVARSLAEVNKKFDDAASLAHKNAEMLDELAAAREREIEAVRNNVRQTYYDAIAQAQGLSEIWGVLDRFRDLSQSILDAGLSAEETAERLAGLEWAEGIEKQKIEFGIVDKLFGYLSESAQFAAQGVEFARMKVELEFGIMRAQLELLGVFAKYAEIFDAAFDAAMEAASVIPDLVLPTTQIRDNFNHARDAAAAMAERLVRAKESISDLLVSMDQGGFGGISPREALANVLAQFRSVRDAARTGAIGAVEQFPETARALLDIARRFGASGPEFQAIFDEIRASGVDLLGLTQAREGNVVFDQRFFDQQEGQTDVLSRGFEANSEEQARMRRELELLRSEVVAMRQAFEAAEAAAARAA